MEDYLQDLEWCAYRRCLDWNGSIPMRAWVKFCLRRTFVSCLKNRRYQFSLEQFVEDGNPEPMSKDLGPLDQLIESEGTVVPWKKGRHLDEYQIKELQDAMATHSSGLSNKDECPCGRESRTMGLCRRHYWYMIKRKKVSQETTND